MAGSGPAGEHGSGIVRMRTYVHVGELALRLYSGWVRVEEME